MLHQDPRSRQQAEELMASLPELGDELWGPAGVLWDDRSEGVLLGLELLVERSVPDDAALWQWALRSMERAGPLPWQQREQHRSDLHALQVWAPDSLPPLALRDICRRTLWMLRRRCQDIEAPPDESPWLRALRRLSDLPAQLSNLEFFADTLEDTPDPEEVDALRLQLRTIGEQIRPQLSELLVAVHLILADARDPRTAQRACRWQQRHLTILLQQAFHKNDR
jgi:hypothetical protein